jgi:coenzyme F420-0:L-glutamate ligase/coenzyme F420-1:gamma-L-glutamate ligase
VNRAPEPIRLVALPGIAAVQPGDDLAALIRAAAQRASIALQAGALVVAQKVVSKAEGRVVALADVTPSAEAIKLAAEDGRDPRQLELVLRESARIVRRGHGVTISETKHGFVCANAGVDLSNAPAPDTAVLLPLDPDASARALRDALLADAAASQLTGASAPPLAVIISDTFGRPWREGLVDVALGSAGIAPIRDLRGKPDLGGRKLTVTATATADQLAAAAGLLMQKDAGTPAVWIEGIAIEGDGEIRDTLRDPATDLFR